MSKGTKIFVTLATAFSAVFAVLFIIFLHERLGIGKTLILCAVGVAAIWLFAYLRGLLWGMGRQADNQKQD